MRWLALAIVLVAAPAWGHGMRTAHVEIAEIAPGQALAHLQLAAPDPALALAAADACTVELVDAAAFARTWRIRCPDGIAEHPFAIVGLGPITSEVVVTVRRADGATATQLVRPDAPIITVPAAAASACAVARQFVGLGLVHILTGYDHLLFLLLIVLLLRDARSVLIAESAFTLSHTISFTATALGWIALAPEAAEVCIALSLVLLAAEIDPAAPTPSRWRGAVMAFAFGLVHGLGFAGGLRELGLPDQAISESLVGFAGGIELGQIAFLALVLAVTRALREVTGRPRIERGVILAIGGFSAYLVIARGLALAT